jgi:YYY domain-containing protein
MLQADNIVFQVDDGTVIGEGEALLDQSPGTLPAIDDARWSADITGNSWGALVAWVILLVVLQAAMWPVVRRVFARFSDRGWGFSRLLTMIVAGYLVWLPASLEMIAFRAVWCGVALVATAIGAYGVSRIARPRDAEFPWFRDRSILIAETVFWSVFGLFLLFRLINHDSYHPIWGGEKPMEFAHINAILRSAHFPPVDPWYAGGTLNYYYYGAYLVAFLMKVTGIPSEIAFNLAQPTLMALLASGTFSVAVTLGRRFTGSLALARWTGLIGVVLMVISGNLIVAARLISSIGESGTPPLSDYVYWFWTPTRVLPGQVTIHEFPYFTGTYADLHAHGVALSMTVLTIGLCLALVDGGRAFVLAVTRPTVCPQATMAVALTISMLPLVFGTLYMTNAWDVPTYGAFIAISLVLATRVLRSVLVRAVTIAAVGMSVAAITYLLVTPFRQHYVTLYGEIDSNRTVTPLTAVLGHFGVFFLIVTFGLAFVIASQVERPPGVLRPEILFGGMSLALLSRWYAVDRSQDWIDVTEGVVVLVPVLFLLFGLLVTMPRTMDARLPSALGRVAVLVAWVAVLWSLAEGKPSFALFLGLGSVAAVLWLTPLDPVTRFTMGMVAGGMFVGAAMELVFLVDDLRGGEHYRMNSVFKFYMAVWVLLALASAGFVSIFLRRAAAWSRASVAVPEAEVVPAAERHLVDPLRDDPRTRLLNGWASVGLLVSTLAIIASLAFPVFSTRVRLDQQFAQAGRSTTLNALDWMSYGEMQGSGNSVGVVNFGFAEDRDVIDWFNANVAGTPVIAEANIGIYRCAGNRISIHTGLPDVVGWTWHETQQRGQVDLLERDAALELLYTSVDPQEKVAILDRYGVEYVVIGQLERYYPQDTCTGLIDNSEGIAAFEPLVGSRLEVAFQSGETVVYRVIRE